MDLQDIPTVTGTDHRGVVIDAGAYYRYLLSRQNPDAGFCFYRSWGVNESNAPDTLAAVAGLRCLGRSVPRRQEVIQWVCQQQRTDGSYATLTIGWACLQSLSILQAQPLYDGRRWIGQWMQKMSFPTGKARNWSDFLRDYVRLLQVAMLLELPIDASLRRTGKSLLDKLKSDPGGYGDPKPTLIDTSRAGQLSTLMGLPPDDGILGYVHQCEHPVYGFRATADSITTSLEVQLAGMSALALFSALPAYPDAIVRFLEACQTPCGGFSRVPGALTRLDDTWRALEIGGCLRSQSGNSLSSLLEVALMLS